MARRRPPCATSSRRPQLRPQPTRRIDQPKFSFEVYRKTLPGTGQEEDGPSGAANCDLRIELQNPQPQPELAKREPGFALDWICSATARPRAANLIGGKIPTRLTLSPEENLILGGQPMPRGGSEYYEDFTERRVERS